MNAETERYVRLRQDDLEALVTHVDGIWAQIPTGVAVLQRANALLAEQDRRMASPNTGAAMRWHFLDPQVNGRGVQRAICGEAHRDWWPLTRFKNADSFGSCAECVRLDESS